MKIPFLNIWVTRMDWKGLYYKALKKELGEDMLCMQVKCESCKKFESKFKRTHDQLRREQTTDWDKLKEASKQEGFKR